jgi:MFS family permease
LTPSERQVLRITGASHALIHVYELATPALLILIQGEFGAGDFAMGGIVSLYGVMFGLGALPAGIVADRIGSKSLLVACLWGAALCLCGMALSHSLVMFAMFAGCMGLALSIYHPAGTALLSHSLPPTGGVFAAHGMAGNLGVAGSSLVAGALGALVGWRLTLGLLAAAGVLLGVRALALTTPAPREVRQRPGRWHGPDFALLLVAAAFLGMVYRGTTTFLPKFLATSYTSGTTSGVAVGGLLTTLALLAGVGGMFVAGRGIDGGSSPARVFLLGAAAQLPFLAALGFAGGGLLLPLAMLMAFAHFFTQPPGNRLVVEFTPPRLRGVGYGVYFLVSFGAGALGSTVGGWVSEHRALADVFPALAVVGLPGVLAALALAARRRVRG